jgi:hypothetical protein
MQPLFRDLPYGVEDVVGVIAGKERQSGRVACALRPGNSPNALCGTYYPALCRRPLFAKERRCSKCSEHSPIFRNFSLVESAATRFLPHLLRSVALRELASVLRSVKIRAKLQVLAREAIVDSKKKDEETNESWP